MNKNHRRIISYFLVLSCLTVFMPSYAVEDDLSPDTLPDEIPTEQNFGHPLAEEKSKREIQSNSGKPTASEAQDPDSELDKPLIPLFPTEPLETNLTDEALATPDLNYSPPKVTTASPEKGIAPQIDSQVSQKPKPEEPKPAALPPVAEIKLVKPDITAPELDSHTSRAKPASTPRLNFVWAPQILQQMLADPLNLVPIDTYISRLAIPPTAPSRPPKGVSDFSIILSNNEFYPAKIILKTGSTVRLLFTTTNKKSAALVIEKLNIQRWISSQFDGEKTRELDRTKFEVNRELSANRVTEITFQAKPGTYSFHDVITGASGEILVEEQ